MVPFNIILFRDYKCTNKIINKKTYVHQPYMTLYVKYSKEPQPQDCLTAASRHKTLELWKQLKKERWVLKALSSLAC